MARVGHHHRSRKVMAFNATPMFDMMFTLTIFFLLACRLSSAERMRMELPRPEDSRASIARMPQRVVINCRYVPAESTGRAGGGVVYSLGPNLPEPLPIISERLSGMRLQTPALEAVVRADRRLRYADVRAAMGVVAANRIKMLNVVAHVGESE